MRQQVRKQLHALIQGPLVIANVRARMEILIATLDGQIAEVEAELAAVVAQDTGWTAAIRRLQRIPGVGLLTAAWLVVGTLSFTLCATAEQATASAGLAPMPRESGSSLRGRATIGRGGNGRLRTPLYMATLSAAQHNPAINACYRRSRDAGKPPKVARCAAARKLLHLVWAIGTKQSSPSTRDINNSNNTTPQSNSPLDSAIPYLVSPSVAKSRPSRVRTARKQRRMN